MHFKCITGHLQVFDMGITGLSHRILPNGGVPLGGSASLEDGAGLKVWHPAAFVVKDGDYSALLAWRKEKI